MKKLVSLLIAAAFALSSGFAVAASHAGAQPMEKKAEAKKGGEKKAASKKAAPKKDASKKAAPKKAAKDEMKK
jgi:Ni/Co efflux regulator RcnB